MFSQFWLHYNVHMQDDATLVLLANYGAVSESSNEDMDSEFQIWVRINIMKLAYKIHIY